MSGINDKPEEWYQWAQEIESVTPSTCADQLMELARTAWHPINGRDDAKEAPQEMVMVRKTDGTPVQVWGPSLRSDWDVYTDWARVNDVVLMPPQGGE